MKSTKRTGPLAAAIVMLWLAVPGQSAAQECQFAPVKAQIDTILDSDKSRGTKFRKAVKDGEDSIEVLNELVDKKTRNMIDTCRFYVAEYLAKRGYPPAH